MSGNRNPIIHASLLCEVDLDDVPDWQEGPLPVATGEVQADRSSRLSYYETRAGLALYGSTEQPCRWHDHSDAQLRECRVEATELVAIHSALDVSAALLVVHLAPQELGIDSLGRLGTLDGDSTLRQFVERELGGFARIRTTARRAFISAFAMFDDGPTPVREAPDEWEPEAAWRWLLASGTPFASYPPDPLEPSLLNGTIYLSASWRGLVLRDGMSFVALRPAESDDFYRTAPAYTRSIYLDAAVLALMQRRVLNDLANDLAAIGDRYRDQDAVDELETRLTDFRNLLWWEHVTAAGPAHDILRRMQSAYRLPELLASLIADLTDFSRQTQTRIDIRTNRAVTLLTVWGLPIALALALGPIALDNGAGPAAIVVLIGLVLALAAQIVFGRFVPVFVPRRLRGRRSRSGSGGG